MNSTLEDAQFARWLHEWTSFQEFEESESLRAEADSHDPQPACVSHEALDEVREQIRKLLRPFDAKEKPRPMEIRLLSAESIPGERPVWIAVLESNDRCLIAPFSKFSAPATPYELETSDGVLNLWQAARVSPEALAKSWIGKDRRLSEQDLQDAMGVLEAYRSYQRPPESLRPRTGARLSRHQADPRHAYLAAEKALLAPLKGSEIERAIPPQNAHAVVLQIGELINAIRGTDSKLKLAADDRVVEVPEWEFRLPAHGVRVLFSLDTTDQSVRWNVFDEQNEYSDALNGFRIAEVSSGATLGEITASSGSIPRLPANTLVLLSPDGTAVEGHLVIPD